MGVCIIKASLAELLKSIQQMIHLQRHFYLIISNLAQALETSGESQESPDVPPAAAQWTVMFLVSP